VRFIGGLDALLPAFVGVALLAGLITLLATPVVRLLVSRFEMVDHPDARRLHAVPIPRGGGIAVALGFLAAGGGAVLIGRAGLADGTLPGVPGSLEPALVALAVGAVAAIVIGAVDDYFELRARWQLLGQLVLAGIAISSGLAVGTVANPVGPGTIRFDGGYAVVFTALWIVGMMNSINFIDGLDGLSSGIGVIAATTLGLISLTTSIGQPLVALLCFALAGSLLGFLRWNVHPASIFVGTSGVMLMGYTLAVLSIIGTAKVAVALLVLGVPIIDTFWNIVRRLASGRSPFTPDRGHIHHRLLDLGLTQRQTVLLIYGICIALGALSFVLSGSGQVYAFLAVVILSGVGLLGLTRRSLRLEELERDSYLDPATGATDPRDRSAR
jgi:UDP-GlcNAc:undecaprenyl-phosphate GlcNAc-1-phosphate transferase